MKERKDELGSPYFNDKQWKEQQRKMHASETVPSEKPVFSPPLNQNQMNEILLETKEELQRRGDFDLIFPVNNNKYDKFFHPSKIPLYKFMREHMQYPSQTIVSNVHKAKVNLTSTLNIN